MLDVRVAVEFTTAEIAGPIAGFLILGSLSTWFLLRLIRRPQSPGSAVQQKGHHGIDFCVGEGQGRHLDSLKVGNQERLRLADGLADIGFGVEAGHTVSGPGRQVRQVRADSTARTADRVTCAASAGSESLRALSPALNDPTTAEDVVRQLAVPLKTLLLGDVPGRVVGDERGNKVYAPRAYTFSDYIHGAFTEIRLNAGGQPYTLLALVETLGSLLGILDAADRGRSVALRREAAFTIETIRMSDMSEHEKTNLYEAARAAVIEVT